MIRRLLKNLGVYEGDAPTGTAQLERDGWTMLPAVFEPAEVAELREADRRDLRHRARRTHPRRQGRVPLRDAQPQRGVPGSGRRTADPRGRSSRCSARTVTSSPTPRGATRPSSRAASGTATPDRTCHGPSGVAWDDRIPYPVFAVGAHIYLQDCTRADGPTAVVPGQPPLGTARAVRPDVRRRPHLRRSPAGA